MPLEQTLDAYRRFAKRQGLPDMYLAGLKVETRDLEDPGSAWSALKAEYPLEGWLLFQSQVVVFAEHSLPEPEPAWGLLLAAETYDEGGRSLSIRTLAPGRLRLVIAEHQPNGTDYLADEVKHWATGKVLERTGKVLERTGCRFLHYRRYWRRDPQDGLVPFFAAFRGFDNQAKGGEHGRQAPL